MFRKFRVKTFGVFFCFIFFFVRIYRVEKKKEKKNIIKSNSSMAFRYISSLPDQSGQFIIISFCCISSFFFSFLLSGINGFSQFDFFHEKKM